MFKIPKMAMVILTIAVSLWLKLICCNKCGKCHSGINQDNFGSLL